MRALVGPPALLVDPRLEHQRGGLVAQAGLGEDVRPHGLQAPTRGLDEGGPLIVLLRIKDPRAPATYQ